MLHNFLPQFLPFTIAFADDATATTPTFVTNILGYAGGIGGAVVAIFLIVSIVKDAISLANGQGSTSIWKIIGKVALLILMIGLIFLAMNYTSLGNTAKNIGQGAIDAGAGLATNVLV